mmetsp:Transcript_22991/g.42305  ORF Transcript_22991/g.42305 Transcript_22991/m.42305 type:complete len:999 (-) Transcript_22991:7-3003(-)
MPVARIDAMRVTGKGRAFQGGVDLRGPLALSVTQRQGGARNTRRRVPDRRLPDGRSHLAESQENEAPGDSEEDLQAGDMEELEEQPLHGEILEAITTRTMSLIELLRNAPDVKAPSGVPCEGKVVNFDAALAFTTRYCRLLRDCGPEVAAPRVTYHWTAEENFQSIVETNLRVPDPATGVKKKHGAAFGRGIYTCPDLKMAREDFAYGASATFVCLALPGRQKRRQHGRGHGLKECRGAGFDSVVGHLPNRYVDTWVFPESAQLLPCFLVDELAVPSALNVLRQAIRLIQEPWPEAFTVRKSTIEGELVPGDDSDTGGDSDSGSTSSRALVVEPATAGEEPPAIQGQSRRAWRRRKVDEDADATKIEMLGLEACPSVASTALPHVAGDGSGQTAQGRRWGAARLNAPVQQEDKPVITPPIRKAPTQSRGGTVLVKAGDILGAEEEFIAHQCNCVSSTSAQGVAEAIFRAFPNADVYKQRAGRGRSHDIPGSVSVHGRVVNLYSQLLPGRPADDAPPGGWPGTGRYVSPADAASDTRSERLRWFIACLAALPRSLPSDRAVSIAFPAKIGCGLAGGHWQKYLQTLRRFAATNSMWKVVIYDIEGKLPPEPEHSVIEVMPECEPACSSTARSTLGTSRFWQSATFEAARKGTWEAYSAENQLVLQDAVRSMDACEEALVDAARHVAVASVQSSESDLPDGFRDPHDCLHVALAGPTARLQDCNSSQEIDVHLAAIVSGLGYGKECIVADRMAAPIPVRLRLAPVRSGELRLPEDLDESSGAPSPQDCGRLVDGVEELAALAEASGSCTICLNSLSAEDGKPRRRAHARRPVVQLFCGHAFHEACLARWFEERRNCPACKRRFGHLVGRQPCVGTMAWHLDSTLRLPGSSESFTVVLDFNFPAGVDSLGQRYRGRSQRAYLPHDEQGKLLLELFRLAFQRRVLFDLRISSGSDAKYWPAFNIHLKTQVSGGPERHGYPDDGYFHRVMEELKDSGVTVAELA